MRPTLTLFYKERTKPAHSRVSILWIYNNYFAMNRQILLSLMLLFGISLSAQEGHHFVFHYGLTIKDVPASATVRVWIPAAHSDPFQEVKVLSATGDLPFKMTRESRFNNQMFYAQTAKSDKPEIHFEIAYDVVRHERLTLGAATPHLADVTIKDKERKQFLEPDKLAPVTGPLLELAAKATDGMKTPLEKARAIYDYVFENMKYDAAASEHADALVAADLKKGDCVDFHSLFIAMARSQSIPARFEIGFAVPDHSGEITGYDCWAEFFEPIHGWVPIDISQASLHPEKKDFFFGAHEANRVQFTVGRDIVLNPKQDGTPLNYFVYPYVEVGGKPYSNVSWAFSVTE